MEQHTDKQKSHTVHKPALQHKKDVNELFEVVYSPNEVRTLLSWSAPSRPFQKRKKIYYINMLLIMFTVMVILFLFSQYLLMLVVVSIAFVSFALSSTPPNHNQYHISTEGLAIEDHFYLWQELYDFYFKQRNGIDYLHIRTKAYFPGELILMLGDIPKDKMRGLLLPFLPYREVVRSTFTEKAGDWLVKT